MAALNLYYRDMLMVGRVGKAAFFLGDKANKKSGGFWL